MASVTDVLDLTREWLGSEPDSLARCLYYLGDFLWLVAYATAIREGFKQRTCCVPLGAVCLNIAWEIQYSEKFLQKAWLVFDGIILLQLFIYGRARQLPLIQKLFYPFLVGTLAMAYMGESAFPQFFAMDMRKGIVGLAFILNLAMSILFIFFVISSLKLHGVSLVVGWTKMLGTACVGIANLWMRFQRGIKPFDPGTIFLTYLIIFIFVFDVWYIALTYQLRKRAVHDLGTA